MKKFLLLLSAVIIIALSFITPKILFEMEDLSREKEVFARVKKESKIDVQAEKIYLVRFIHDIYDLKSGKVYYENNKTSSVVANVPLIQHIEDPDIDESIKEEVSKLMNIEIIKEVNLNEYTSHITMNTFSQECSAMTNNLTKENNSEIGVSVEEKTGKIISLDFNKSLLRTDKAKKTQLENYAKYLDLDIIGDWKYENQTLKSEKAQLIIMMAEGEYDCMLTIAPIEIYEKYVGDKYEIVTEKKK